MRLTNRGSQRRGLAARRTGRRRPGVAALCAGRHPHMMNLIESRLLLAAMAGWIIIQPGCSRSPSPRAGHAPVAAARRVLSEDGAARLAAQLANDQCERQYHRRPFLPEQHSAVSQEGIYRWGGLDVGGPGGFSALVTFREDGTEPHVEVYFSSDALRPPRRPVAPPPEGAPKPK